MTISRSMMGHPILLLCLEEFVLVLISRTHRPQTFSLSDFTVTPDILIEGFMLSISPSQQTRTPVSFHSVCNIFFAQKLLYPDFIF